MNYLFLLAFAGIPLTSGFVSKFAVFKAAGEGGAIPLVVIGVIASAIAAYFYVRVIVLMFFTEPPDDPPAVVVPSVLTTAVVTITAAVTFALGALPQPLLDLANTGKTAYLGATFTIEASDTFEDATYNGDATATSGTLTLDTTAQTDTWTGDLAPGASVTVTFSVFVGTPGPEPG